MPNLPQSSQSSRSKRLRHQLEAAGADASLVTHLPDVFYMTGFTGSNAALLVGQGRPVLFTDARYTQQARQQVTGARVVIGKRNALSAVAAHLKGFSGRLSVDSDHVTVAELQHLKKALKATSAQVRVIAKPGAAAKLREIKDAGELALMREAAALGCKLFAELREHIVPGVPESEVAARLEYSARVAGAERMSFETIVAGGVRGALAHGVASRAKLPRNGLVVLDFGVVLQGYCSDMTRTVPLGRPSREERGAYEAVLEAQMAAVEAVRPGVTCGEVDEAARAVLRRAKLAKYFTHSTGHGVGIEIHERPRIAAKEKAVLQPGMVITIEPGVYLPGRFGVRIEDMVAVTASGHATLTTSPKEWQA